MVGRILTAGIVVFWMVMMGLLAHREILPAWEREREFAQSASYAQLEQMALRRPVTQMGIYFGGARVGSTLSVLTKDATELRMQSRSELDLSPLQMGAAVGVMLFGAPSVNLSFDARATEGRLISLRLEVRAPRATRPVMRLTGRPVGDKLDLTIKQYDTAADETGGVKQPKSTTYTVPFDTRQLITNSLAPTVAFPNLELGKHFYMRTLNTSTGRMQKTRVDVAAKEFITVAGKEYEAFRLAITLPAGVKKASAWVTPDGEMLRQEILGVVLVREEPPADALERVRQ